MLDNIPEFPSPDLTFLCHDVMNMAQRNKVIYVSTHGIVFGQWYNVMHLHPVC
jgi:hypothetical protein